MADVQHDPSLDTEEEFEVDLSALANGKLPTEWLEALQKTGQLPENLLTGPTANTDPTASDGGAAQIRSPNQFSQDGRISDGSASQRVQPQMQNLESNGAAGAPTDARQSLREVQRRASTTPTYLPSPRERERLQQKQTARPAPALTSSPSTGGRRDSMDSRPGLYDEHMSTNGGSQQGDSSKGFDSHVPRVDEGWYSHIESWQRRKHEKLQDMRAEKQRQESQEEQHGFRPKLAPGTRRRQVQGRAVDRMYKWQHEREARLAEKQRKAADLAADPELTFKPDTRKNKETLKYGPGKAPPPSTAGIDGDASALSDGGGPNLNSRKLPSEELHAIRARQQSDVEAFAQRMQKAREAAKDKEKLPKPGSKYTGKTTVPREFNLSSRRRSRETGQGGAKRAQGTAQARVSSRPVPASSKGGYARYAKGGARDQSTLPEPGTAGSGMAYLQDAQRKGMITAAVAPAAEPPVGAAYAKYAADVAQLLTASPASVAATATGSEGLASNDGLPTPEDAPRRNLRFSSPPQPSSAGEASPDAARTHIAFAGDTRGQGSTQGTFPATPPPGGHVAWGVTFAGESAGSPHGRPPPPPPNVAPIAAGGLQPLSISSPNGATPRGGAGGFAPATRHVPTPAHTMPPDEQTARAWAVQASAAALAPDSPQTSQPQSSPPGMTVQFVSGGAEVHSYPAHTHAMTPGAAPRAAAGHTPRFNLQAQSRTFAAGATPHARALPQGTLDFQEPPDSAGQERQAYVAPPQADMPYSPSAGHTPHPSRGGGQAGFAAQGTTAGHTPHPSRGGGQAGFAANAPSPTHNLNAAFASAGQSPHAPQQHSGVSPHVSFATGAPQVSGGGHVSWAGAVQSPPARSHVPPTPHPSSGNTRDVHPPQDQGGSRQPAPQGSPASSSLDQLTAQLASVRAELDAERERAAHIRGMSDSYSSGAVPPTPAPPPPQFGSSGQEGTPTAWGAPMPSTAPGHFYSAR